MIRFPSQVSNEQSLEGGCVSDSLNTTRFGLDPSFVHSLREMPYGGVADVEEVSRSHSGCTFCC